MPACMRFRITAGLEPLCPIGARHHFCFYVNRWQACLTHGRILAFKWLLEFFNCAIVVDKCCLVKLLLFDKAKKKNKNKNRETFFILSRSSVYFLQHGIRSFSRDQFGEKVRSGSWRPVKSCPDYCKHSFSGRLRNKPFALEIFVSLLTNQSQIRAERAWEPRSVCKCGPC